MTRPYTWNNQPCVIVRKYEDKGDVWYVIQTQVSGTHGQERVMHVRRSTFDKAQEAAK